MLLLISMMTVSAFCYAQVNGGLQGPAAKNYKYWLDEDNKPQPTEVVTKDQEPLQGPAAKNHQAWKDDGAVTYGQVETSADRPRLMGPKAKNSKPWKYSQYTKVDTPDEPEDPSVPSDLKSRKEP